MEVLEITSTEDCPDILFNPNTGVFSISGRSLPEDPPSFFKPVFQWLSEYALAPHAATLLNIKLDYFNTSSARQVMELLIALEKIESTDRTVTVNWYYVEGDDLMHDRGDEIASLVNVSVNVLPL